MERINRAERRRSSRKLAKQPEWGTLEAFTRGRIQGWLQDLLEEEVSELLGRRRSERRGGVGAPAGYPKGHGKSRRVSIMARTMGVRRAGGRGVEQRFESLVRALFWGRPRHNAGRV